MRVMTIGIGALAALGVVALYFALAARKPADVSALVPPDFEAAVFCRSLDDLRLAYEGPNRRRDADADPAANRFGTPLNVPGLAGIAQHEPIGSYVADGNEIFLVPVTDTSALEDAFEKRGGNLKMRAPVRVAKNYVSMSMTPAHASRHAEDPLLSRVRDFPISAYARPRGPETIFRLHGLLLAREAPPHESVPDLLATMRPGDGPANFLARECEELLIGVHLPEAPQPFRFTLAAKPRDGGVLARATRLAADADLLGLVAPLPFNTLLAFGAALDGAGWKELGLPLALGDGAFAAGIVEEQGHARPYNVILAARPVDPAALAGLRDAGAAVLLDAGAAAPEFASADDVVRVARLPHAPERLKAVLRVHSRTEPALYLATADVDGCWYAAIGSQAEAILRRTLSNRRKTPELGVRALRFLAAHDGFWDGPAVAAAWVSKPGLRAFGLGMPFVQLVSVGEPAGASVVVRPGDLGLVGDLRLHR
jgi:hypothetical protein